MISAAGVEVGDVLAGKYRIERLLGMGGMGVVVAAHHMQLDQKVAIKFLLPDMLPNPDAVDRFSREARAAVKIKSEHVARVIDVGALDNGSPYMVMEYLDGVDLASWLEQRGPQPVEQAVDLLLQACEAIAEAHAFGIVHRDLKPSNLFIILRSDGLYATKVLDFGISKVTGANSAALGATKTAAVMGSPLYMCPEQMQSTRSVDGRADIWALGVILHEMLCGEAPFRGDTLPEICFSIAMEPPRSLREVRPDAPPAIEAAILKCLEKDREKRFRNVAELAQALVQFGPSRSRASVERITRTIENAAGGVRRSSIPPETSASVPRAAPRTMTAWGQSAPPLRRSHRTKIVGVAMCTLVAGALALVLLRKGGRDAPLLVEPTAPAVTTPGPTASAPVDDPTPPPATYNQPPALPSKPIVRGPLPSKSLERPARAHAAATRSASSAEKQKPGNDLGGRL